MEDPTQSDSWRQYRMDLITHLANDILIPEVHKRGKLASAAVFPNWTSVKQEWKSWHMDAVLPMLYNGFYEAPVAWVGEQVQWGKANLKHSETQLYSGLFLPDLTQADSLKAAVRHSLKNGAEGISLFAMGGLTEAQWKALEEMYENGEL
ncbi:hypothetical protein [Persicobacter sp. CCB-QB2]|uniref:hypothetical protein n=1 Tax=Persicobacter sp. CCB-QB2 TaxID=1561025 RepID=UPI0006A9AE05|nr:hypothetical protein [Persicobacter sp. CCB-QB2]